MPRTDIRVSPTGRMPLDFATLRLSVYACGTRSPILQQRMVLRMWPLTSTHFQTCSIQPARDVTALRFGYRTGNASAKRTSAKFGQGGLFSLSRCNLSQGIPFSASLFERQENPQQLQRLAKAAAESI
eukprot:2763493-Rhodomonas_salina.1